MSHLRLEELKGTWRERLQIVKWCHDSEAEGNSQSNEIILALLTMAKAEKDKLRVTEGFS